MPDFLNITKAMSLIARGFSIAESLYRAALVAGIGGWIVYQTGGPIMLAVVAYGVCVVLRPEAPANRTGLAIAIVALSLAVDPAGAYPAPGDISGDGGGVDVILYALIIVAMGAYHAFCWLRDRIRGLFGLPPYVSANDAALDAGNALAASLYDSVKYDRMSREDAIGEVYGLLKSRGAKLSDTDARELATMWIAGHFSPPSRRAA